VNVNPSFRSGDEGNYHDHLIAGICEGFDDYVRRFESSNLLEAAFFVCGLLWTTAVAAATAVKDLRSPEEIKNSLPLYGIASTSNPVNSAKMTAPLMHRMSKLLRELEG
jgi:hypothetical protein